MSSIKNKSTTKQMMPPKLRLQLANECPNILLRVDLKPTTKERKFRLLNSEDVDSMTYFKLMNLFEKLMKDLYSQSSWGWKPEEKLKEWNNPRTKIIVVTLNDDCETETKVSFNEVPHNDQPIVGFMCFRFEKGGNKNECALYVWELHVDTDFQRQGLGEELMNMAKNIAVGFKMDKVMLTSFRSNQQALKFYKKLNFIPDKSSPATNEADYVILSQKVKF